MEVLFLNDRIEKQCTDFKIAKKMFGGNDVIARSLMARIEALKQADTLKDIVVMPTFHFHKLNNQRGNNLEGYFAIDVKTRREPWRIIIEPLDDNKSPFVDCNIDQIAQNVRIIEIMEVSNHYE